MALSAFQLNAAAGLLQNTGLIANTNLTGAIASYSALPLVTAITTTMANGVGILTNATITSLETLGTTTCPALADSVPYANITKSTAGFSGTISLNANIYLGSGNVSKFAQFWSQATGYIDQTNQIITTSSTSQTYLGPTFTNMNELATGGLSNITTDPQAFGADLAKLGSLINPANLENWGTPMALVRQLVNLTGIVPPPIQIAFVALGVDQTIAVNLDDPTTSVADSVQKTMWQAMQNITGTSLAQIMQILGVTTANITAVSDLLNPVKILPNSYQTILTPTAIGFVPIYTNQSGSVNPLLAQQLPGYALRSTDAGFEMTAVDRTSFMTTNELALANKALAISLLQITGVVNLNLQEIAATFTAVELINQPLVNAQTTPVSPSLAAFFATQMAPGGTGPGNTLVVSDVLGTSSGYRLTGQFANTVSNIANINVGYLTTVYQTMLDVVDGVYGIAPVVIPSGPGAGTYANRDAAITTGLIPDANTTIVNLQSTYPSQTANLNLNWQTMGTQVTTEQTLQSLAAISFTGNITSSTQSTMAFVTNLPASGLDTVPGGQRDFLTAIADTSILAGQSIIATMTQGANDAALSAAGLHSNSAIPQ